ILLNDAACRRPLLALLHDVFEDECRRYARCAHACACRVGQHIPLYACRETSTR
ncbi:hypothetical protein AAVH_34354, partial [Aphelenchoides avenae]